MVKNIILDTLFIFLITYAFTDIVYNLLKLLNPYEKKKKHKEIIAVLIDNDICNIENTVRQTAKYARQINCEFVLLYDCLSEENMEIINKLSGDFPQMRLKCCRDNTFSEIFADASSKDV